MLIYRFNDFTLDTGLHELRYRAERRAVEPQVFKLLAFLIENRERLVTKQELVDAVWDGRAISDATLNSRINAARRTVGDTGKTQATIRTIARRGFRFVAEVDVPIALPGGLRRTHEPAMKLPRKPSIVVLPFVSVSDQPEQGTLADGITDDIITRLAKLRSLFVISRNTAFVFRDRTVRIEDVARDLGVGHVLEGSVRRAGDRVRVAARLLDGRTGASLWAERYERNLGDTFQIQDDITQAIAVALQVRLTEGEMARLLAVSTKSIPAWEAVNSGIRFMDDHSRANNVRARSFFAEALRHDPDYAQAKAFLAFTHFMDKRFGFVSDGDGALDIAKALLKEIETAAGHTSASEQVRALIALTEGRHDDAMAAAELAVELGPNDSWANMILGEVQLYGGDPASAVGSLHAAIRLSPYCPADYVYYLAYAHLWLSEHNRAIAVAEDYAERLPEEPFAYTLLACVHGLAGRDDDARAATRVLRAKFPTFTVATYAPTQYYRDPDRLARLVAALRDAGLPDPCRD